MTAGVYKSCQILCINDFRRFLIIGYEVSGGTGKLIEVGLVRKEFDEGIVAKSKDSGSAMVTLIPTPVDEK